MFQSFLCNCVVEEGDVNKSIIKPTVFISFVELCKPFLDHALSPFQMN